MSALMTRLALAPAALGVAATLGAAAPAEARGFVTFGLGLPIPGLVAPAPVYAAPVYAPPPPAYYAPPPGVSFSFGWP